MSPIGFVFILEPEKNQKKNLNIENFTVFKVRQSSTYKKVRCRFWIKKQSNLKKNVYPSSSYPKESLSDMHALAACNFGLDNENA